MAFSSRTSDAFADLSDKLGKLAVCGFFTPRRRNFCAAAIAQVCTVWKLDAQTCSFLTWIVKTLVGEFYRSCKHLCGIVAAVWLTLAAQKY